MSGNRASVAHETYRIEVADFGPIARAEVDLRPLTVFAGPSNTGKSYLAMVVYARHRCLGSSSPSLYRLSRRRYWFGRPILRSLPDRDRLSGLIANWRAASREHAESVPPEELAVALRPALEQPGNVDRYLAEEVRRCFGVDEHSVTWCVAPKSMVPPWSRWSFQRHPRQKAYVTSFGLALRGCVSSERSLLYLDLRAWFAALHASPAAANRSLPILSVILRQAELYGHRPDDSNPCTGLRRYPERGRERFLTSDAIRRLGVALAVHEAVALLPIPVVRLLLLTGCRQSEIRTAQWRDYREGHLFLRDSKVGPRTVWLSSPHCCNEGMIIVQEQGLSPE